MSKFIVSCAVFDWMTLISNKPDCNNEIMERWGNDGNISAGRSQQYKGYTLHNGVFVGHYDDAYGRSYQARVNGSLAHSAVNLLRYRVRPSRIDIQVTVPIDDTYDPSMYHAKHKKDVVGKFEIYNDESDMGTLGIGVRKDSQRYGRVYVKKDNRGNRWLRFELELKNERAHMIPERLKTVPYSELCGSELLWLIGKFPQKSCSPAFDNARDSARRICINQANGQQYATLSKSSEDSNTVKWLFASVLSAFRKLVNAHDRDDERLAQWVSLINEIWDNRNE